MTHLPPTEPPNPTPENPRNQRKRKLWFWLTLILTTGTGVSMIILWVVIQHYVRPIVKKNIEYILQRPIELGNLHTFSPTHIRFGKTHLPATAEDSDFATVEAINVTFNPIPILTQRRLGLNISLIRANASIEQNSEGGWIVIPQPEPREPGPIDFKLDSLRLKNSEVTLTGQYSDETFKEPLTVSFPSGRVNFSNNLEHFYLQQLKGQFSQGGKFVATGEVTFAEKKLDNLQGKVALTAQKIALQDLDNLAPKLPLEVLDGYLGANVTIALDGNPLKRETWPKVIGVAQVKKIALNIDDFEPNVTISQGTFEVLGDKIRLNDITAKLQDIPAVLGGTVSLKESEGFDVSVNVLPVQLEKVFTTLDLDPKSIPVVGEITVIGQLTGQLNDPMITGTLNDIKSPPKIAQILKIDKTPLEEFEADFIYNLNEERLIIPNFTASPTVGGTVTGQGKLLFGDIQTVFLTANAENISGDQIAKQYNIDLPLNVSSLDATATVTLPLENWQNLQATVSSNGLLGGGEVTATNINIQDQQWQGTVEASGVRLNQLLDIPQGLKDQLGTANATVNLSGSLENSGLESLNITGKGFVNVAGGVIGFSNLKFNQDLTASLGFEGVQLGKIVPRFAPKNVNIPLLGALNGSLNVSADLEGLKPQSLKSAGTVTVGVSGGTVTARNLNWETVLGQRELKLENLTHDFTANIRSQGINLDEIVAILPVNNTSLPSLGSLNTNLNVSGNIQGLTPTQLKTTGGTVTVGVAGGTVTANNLNWETVLGQRELKLENLTHDFTASIRSQGINLDEIVAILPLKNKSLPSVGSLNARLNVAGNIQGLTPTQLKTTEGTVTVGVAGGTLTANNLSWNTVNSSRTFDENFLQNLQHDFTAKIQSQGINLEELITKFPLCPSSPCPLAPLPPLGRLNGVLAMTGQVNGLQPQNLQGSGNITVGVAGGTVTTQEVSLQNNRLTAKVTGNQLTLGTLASLVPLPANLGIQRNNLGQAWGDVQLAVNLNRLNDLSALEVQGQGTIKNIGSGTVQGNFALNQGQWETAFTASGVRPHTVTSLVPSQLQGVASVEFELAGNINDLTVTGVRGSGSGVLNIAGGQVTASRVQLADGVVNAEVQPQNIALGRFSGQLRGRLNGDMAVTASLANFAPQKVEAEGNVTLTEGVSVVTNPLNAVFAWDGQRLNIEQAEAANQLQAAGSVDIALNPLLQGNVLGGIREFNLEVEAENINLAAVQQEVEQYANVPVDLSVLNLRGEGSFAGTVQGTLPKPTIIGNLALRNAAVNKLVFDPSLTGNVELTDQGGTVALTGDTDQLNVTVDEGYLPSQFAVKLDEFTAQGEREGDILAASFANFPLGIIKSVVPLDQFPAVVAAQPVGGDASGTVQVNLTTYEGMGNVAIANPILGPLEGDTFNGDIALQNDVIALTNGNLQKQDTQYQLSGNFTPFAKNPVLKGEVAINNGQVQDVLTTFNIKEIQDIISFSQTWSNVETTQGAALLDTVAVGLSQDADLLDRLRRMTEITQLVEQTEQRKREAMPLPSLTQLDGEFNGNITFSANLKQGLDGVTANLELSGRDWDWGNFSASRVQATANLEEGIITILPVAIESGGGSVALSGTLGTETLSAQLQVTEFPIASIQDLVPLPPAVGFGGKINANANLGGTQANPQGRGRIAIADASVNDTPIDTAEGNFSYSNARLTFSAESILAEEGTPLTLVGQIPYRLPLPNTLPPQDNSIQLQAKLQNDGLALLNILTRQQLAWQGGQGSVNVEVSGQLDPETLQLSNLIANGNAQFAEGIITSRVLPDPVTNLSGEVNFNFDEIEVQQLTGQYGGGNIVIAGTIPTATPYPQDNPLTINLDPLALNLKGLLTGEVQGQVQIAGAALEPEISGNIKVNQGRFELLGQNAAANATAGDETGGLSSRVSFDNLTVQLGNKFAISQRPVVEFLAGGDLTLNGTLANPQVRGEIALQRGYVNLFTTTLRLDQSYDNIARFVPVRGLDPELDIRLVGNVLEATRPPITNNALNSEIRDTATNIGSVQTVRVEATMQGTASELIDSLNAPQTGVQPRQVLALASTPDRSETEIIALMGGGFVNAVAGGDDTALVGGLANLASNTLFSDVQYAIGEALGLSSLAIFPAEVIDEEEKRTGTLGVAMEVGKDFGKHFSVSALQYLTPPDQPTRFNVRYRINDNFTLRGSTDFEGDSRAVLEFESRF